MPYTVDLTKRMPRGAIPSPRHVLEAAMPFIADPKMAVPASFLMWPVQMSSWNNYTMVTAFLPRKLSPRLRPRHKHSFRRERWFVGRGRMAT